MFDFNGSTMTVGVTSAPSAYPVTLVAWFNADSLAAAGGVLSCCRTAAAANHLMTIQAGTSGTTVGLTLNNATTAVNVTGGSPTTGTNRHLAARFLSGNVFLYLDGSQVGTTTHSLTFPSITQMDLGGRQNGSGALAAFLDGRIGEAAVYAGDIGADGVAQLALGVSPLMVRPDILRNYWSLVGDLTDQVGGAHLAQLGGGTATVSAHTCPTIRFHRPKLQTRKHILASGATILKRTTSAATVSEVLIGSGATSLKRLTSSATVAELLVGAGATLLKRATSSATAAEVFTASGATSLPRTVSDGDGVLIENVSATGNSILKRAVSSAPVQEVFTGSSAITLNRAVSAGAGGEVFSLSGATQLSRVTSVATASELLIAAGATLLNRSTSSGAALVGVVNILASGATTLSGLVSSGMAGTPPSGQIPSVTLAINYPPSVTIPLTP